MDILIVPRAAGLLCPVFACETKQFRPQAPVYSARSLHISFIKTQGLFRKHSIVFFGHKIRRRGSMGTLIDVTWASTLSGMQFLLAMISFLDMYIRSFIDCKALVFCPQSLKAIRGTVAIKSRERC